MNLLKRASLRTIGTGESLRDQAIDLLSKQVDSEMLRKQLQKKQDHQIEQNYKDKMTQLVMSLEQLNSEL
jgi:hypothetical protein